MSKTILILVVAAYLTGASSISFYSGSSTPPFHQDAAQTRNARPDGSLLTLDFFAGGSITGSSFEVRVSGSRVTYRETTRGGTKEVQKKSRAISRAEVEEIRKTVLEAHLLTLPSQDFAKEPLVRDQGSYRITLSLDGERNEILCGIPSSADRPLSACQKQIDKLRVTLNKVLDVHIY